MPIDRFGESTNKESGLPFQISLLTLVGEKSQPQTAPNSESLALSFGAGAAAVGASSDLLTNRVLQSVPKERAGIADWWRNNASAATKDMFAAHDANLLKLRLDKGLAEVAHKSAVLDYGQTADDLRPHLAKARADLAAFKSTPMTLAGATEVVEARSAGALKPPTLLPHPKGVEAYYAAMEKPFSALGKGEVTPWHHSLESQTLEARVKTLQQLTEGAPTGKSALKTLGTPHEELFRYKQFASNSPVGKLVETAVAKGEAQALAKTELEAARKALNSELALAPRMHGVPEHFASNAGRKLIAGVGLSALSMSAGYGFDKEVAPALGLKNASDNGLSHGTRLAVDGCLVPAFLLSELPLKYKLPLAATAFSAGRGVNYVTADASVSPGIAKLLMPNHADSLLTGAAVMAPIGGRYKAAAIAASLLPGRVVNMFY